jgi:hypothetical protein
MMSSLVYKRLFVLRGNLRVIHDLLFTQHLCYYSKIYDAAIILASASS